MSPIMARTHKTESEDLFMKRLRECKTEKEKQELRDSMLETIYYQVLDTKSEVLSINARVRRIEEKLVYVGATQEERKFLNIDGSLDFDAINDSCDKIIELFKGDDNYGTK